MIWIGALFGAVFGMLLTKSFWGLFLGAIFGQLLSKGFASEAKSPGVAGPRVASPAVPEVFFRTTFLLMGHIAKSDGRVTETEIQAARYLMQQLKLGADQIGFAMDYFRRGKTSGFDAHMALGELRLACGSRGDLLRVFMELQMRAAILGNGAHGAARAILVRAGETLGLSRLEFVHMEAILRAQYRSEADAGARTHSTYFRPNDLDAAFRELDVPASATDQEVKKAYRRQMSRHHPDKLVANGLPESMAEVAKEKTQRIQEAYEAICAARGTR